MVKEKLYNLFSKSTFGQKMQNSPKAIELFKGSFWSILGAILSKGLIFISWVLVGRILGSEGYGQFGIIRSTVVMFTSFAGFSLGITASKHVAEFLHTDKEKVGRILGLTLRFGTVMGFIVSVIFFVLSPWLASNTLDAPEITNELRVSSFILLFSSINGAQIGALEGFTSFKRIAKINVLQGLLCFPLFIVGAFYFGVNGTIWAFAFSYILICILSHHALKSETQRLQVIIDYKNYWEEKSLLFTYSLPAFLSGLMVTPIKWYADALLVSTAGFNEMGIFTAALTFNNIILVGAGMVSGPFIAIMAKNKNDKINSRFSRFNILLPWAIGVFLIIPFLMFPNVGGMVFGKSFSSKSFEYTFSWILLFTIIIMFKQGLARIMVVYNLQWWSFYSNLLWGFILILSFKLFGSQSASYLAIAYLIAYIINTLIVLPIYYKKKLIPRGTIDSIESFCIWIIIAGVAILGLFLESFLVKIFLLLLFMALLFYLFMKCFKRSV